MKKIQGVLNAINKTRYTAQLGPGITIEYLTINLGSKKETSYGTIRERYYIYGDAEVLITGSIDDVMKLLARNGITKVSPDDGNAQSEALCMLVFKHVMQHAYDLLIKKLSLENYLLIDPAYHEGVFNVALFYQSLEHGPYYKDRLNTNMAVRRTGYKVEDWATYHMNRFPDRG